MQKKIQVKRYDPAAHKEWLTGVIEDDESIRKYFNYAGMSTLDRMTKQDEFNLCFVALIAGKPAGLIHFASYGDGRCYIAHLFATIKRQNIGSQLLTEAIRRAHQDWYFTQIYALTIENEPMDAFLSKHGFKCHGTYKGFTYTGGKFRDQSYWYLSTRA